MTISTPAWFGMVTGQRVDEVRQQQVQSAIISIISLLSADVRLHHKLPLLQTVCLHSCYWETKLHCPSKQQTLLYQDLVDFIIFKYLYQSQETYFFVISKYFVHIIIIIILFLSKILWAFNRASIICVVSIKCSMTKYIWFPCVMNK